MLNVIKGIAFSSDCDKFDRPGFGEKSADILYRVRWLAVFKILEDQLDGVGIIGVNIKGETIIFCHWCRISRGQISEIDIQLSLFFLETGIVHVPVPDVQLQEFTIKRGLIVCQDMPGRTHAEKQKTEDKNWLGNTFHFFLP